MTPTLMVRDVLLVGGGHAHVLLLRRWAMSPLPGVRLTLLSKSTMTPYSGMLPGYIAGHYSHDDIHIDLSKLCAWARVRFIEAELSGLDLERRLAFSSQARPPIGFDLLALDTGSTPDLSIPGSAEHSIPVKPVSAFDAHWQRLLHAIEAEPARTRDIAVVGAGAGGFELLLAMRYRLREHRNIRLHWILRSNSALGERDARVGRIALEEALAQGVEVHRGFSVTRVEPHALHAEDGRVLQIDTVLWCTAAAAPDWIAGAGLATDSRGFVATNAALQSISHPFVFATGDVGTQIETPSPKAGVYAVRQAPYLTENIRRLLLGQELKHYHPQRDFLSLLSLGERRAIASRNGLVLNNALMWRWKDHIDRSFMRRFHELKYRPMLLRTGLPDRRLLNDHGVFSHATAIEDVPSMRCNGCGAKVGQRVLKRVLSRLPVTPLEATLEGLATGGDVARWRQHEAVLVQSVDQIRAIVDDPWLFGRIAVLHALSDIYAASAQPRSAQLIVSVPPAAPQLLERELHALLGGAVMELERAGCSLLGGHSSEGSELTLGVLINAHGDEPLPAPQAGDRLLLSKALGSGVIMAALPRLLATGEEVSLALQQMLLTNADAATQAHRFGGRVLTDITGFGLAGHVVNVFESMAVKACIEIDQLPLLPGSERLARAGVASSLYSANREALAAFAGDRRVDAWQARLIADPQTGGGLLLAIPKGQADACLEALKQCGHNAALIGSVIDGPDNQLR